MIVSLEVVTVSYGAGVGCIPYTMVGEVFTPQHKTAGSCLVQCVRSLTVFILVKTLPFLTANIGLHGIFFVHGCILLFGLAFSWIFLPETKGKSLTELCSLYEK